MPIELTAVGFGYPGRTIFSDLSIRIERGELVAIVGPSGTGKSTLLSLVAGHIRPQHGVVTRPERLMRRDSPDPAAVGWIMQTANVFVRRSALDNVCMPMVVNGDRRRRCLDRATGALHDVGLADRADDRCFTLSGGERQRVVVARALAADAGLILADEPTASLDHANRDLLVSSLAAVARRGVTVIVATHDESVAASCDRVVTL